MGSMYWQLDDCWGVASWSSIDYYGRWKALQHYAKRFYADVLVSPHEEGDQVRIYVVSDKTSAVPAQLRVRLLDLNGRALFTQATAVQIEPLTSKAYVSIPRARLLGKRDPKKVVLSCEVEPAGGAALSTNTYYFALPKEMALPQPRIAATWQQRNDSTFQVTLQSKALARAVNLSLTEKDGVFVDNYFDLLPGEKKEITFKTQGPITLAELKRQLTVRSLVDAF
ncbi:glycoside hydrolase family 2 protein, partial [uncultured Hymenobacter sp.]|uniref:glycoside hydrolase family 2 protein n=1 Tax=uncultured Hymenobacter sp. TaxID=170016 RepID=UPI0035CB81BC